MILSVEGLNPPEITKTFDTPYSEYEAEQCNVARCGNLIVLVHRNHPPHQIELTDEGVTFTEMKFFPQYNKMGARK